MSEELFKPGVCVDIREASEAEIDQIMAKAISLGAEESDATGKEYIKWHVDNDIWLSYKSAEGYPIISVDQALGRDKLNSWVDGKGIPPVGTVCEVTHGGIAPEWGKIEILKHEIDYRGGECDKGRIACIALSEHFTVSVGELFWLYNPGHHSMKFRPIRTEKEMFVERFRKELVNDIALAENAYDMGIRFIKEDSEEK